MRVLIVGCGYVGRALGAELTRQGHEVAGVRRSRGAQADLRSAGIQPIVADITQLGELAALPRGWDWVVNCSSSSGGAAADYREVYLHGTRNLVEWLMAAPPRKFVYTSSTSVYGQNDGSLVTEDCPTEPAVETGQVLVATESLLLEAARQRGFPAAILRVAGIYGPGRGHWFKQYMAGTAVVEGEGQRLLNMIHRDDVVGAIIAALQNGQPGQVYNAADDEPVSQHAFYQWLSATLGGPMPPVVPADAPAASKRGATNKRVSNRRLRLELGCQLKYPTFREGYAAEIERLRQAGEWDAAKLAVY
ncbi:MAG: SDR family oxidoreductase [Verrucomicrobia bacterium]|nr:SDR family oxidoreductase [Verrucomicrobiota bacterium]